MAGFFIGTVTLIQKLFNLTVLPVRTGSYKVYSSIIITFTWSLVIIVWSLGYYMISLGLNDFQFTDFIEDFIETETSLF